MSTQRGASEKKVCTKALIEMSILRRPISMPVLDLAVSPGELECSRHGAGLMILVGKGQSGIVRFRKGQRKADDG
jgi:hypothetical protein